jgi:hypothetical protein
VASIRFSRQAHGADVREQGGVAAMNSVPQARGKCLSMRPGSRAPDNERFPRVACRDPSLIEAASNQLRRAAVCDHAPTSALSAALYERDGKVTPA